MSLDPRYRLARETGFVDHDPADGWHGVIIELPQRAVGNRRKRALEALDRALGAEGRVPQAFKSAPTDLRVATAWVTKVGLGILESKTGTLLKRFEYAQNLKPPRLGPVAPLIARPLRGQAASQANGGRSVRAGAEVRNLYVVIDHGCPFMHPLLRREEQSTRVRAIWDQQPGRGHPPAGFDYGSMLVRDQLDAAMRAASGDEASAYRALGYDALRQRVSHGAHMLGMLLDDRLARRQKGPGRPPGDVLFVQLPQGLLGAPSRAVLSRCLIDALVWIQSQRKANERVILSLSEGSSQGPHDGTSMAEQVLSAFARWAPPRTRSQARRAITNRVFIAAGNGREEQLHAQPNFAKGGSRTLIWRLPPGSELPATLELWVPTRARQSLAELTVAVVAPDGTVVGSAKPGESLHWPSADAPVVSVVSSDWAGKNCSLSLVRIAPTSPWGDVCAPSGDWKVVLQASAAVSATVHAYIGRVKQALGFPLRTAQSTFVPTRKRGHAGPVHEGTIQGLATAAGLVRAAGHVGRSTQPKAARYSALGPSRDGRVLAADWSVRVDDGAVLQGRRSIGNRGGVTFRMNGTSVAAPLAARLVTLGQAVPVKKVKPVNKSGNKPKAPRLPHLPRVPRLKDPFDG